MEIAALVAVVAVALVFVSLMAGLPWSDAPSCTDPTLATVARVVNDELSQDTRQTLAARAAEFIGRVGDPAWLAPKLVAVCLDVALQHLPQPDAALDRRRRRANRRLAGMQQPSRPAMSGGCTGVARPSTPSPRW